MNIIIEQVAALPETEIIIRCREIDDHIHAMAASLRMHSRQISGWKAGEQHLLLAQDILYIDSVDKKTFLYTKESVYETPLKLYELEGRLEDSGFFRAGKSLIVNFHHIRSLRPDFGGRLRLTLSNREVCIVSRQYAGTLRQRLHNKGE